MNTRKTLTVLSVAMIALASGSPLLADRHGTERDGDDARPAMFDAETFGRADANGDGQLSQDELIAFAELRRAERETDRAKGLIARLDGNSDGTLSVEEATTPPQPQSMFERLDADENGQISREEFDAAMTRMHDGPHGGMHRDGHGGDRDN